MLPLAESCPSCRKKTIDSILKYTENLLDRHYIIIAANGGLKTMNSYFSKHGRRVPEISGRVFLDSSNRSFKYDLFDNNPSMYYSYNRKVYKKVLAVPATVRQDLHEFFSGNREYLVRK